MWTAVETKLQSTRHKLLEPLLVAQADTLNPEFLVKTPMSMNLAQMNTVFHLCSITLRLNLLPHNSPGLCQCIYQNLAILLENNVTYFLLCYRVCLTPWSMLGISPSYGATRGSCSRCSYESWEWSSPFQSSCPGDVIIDFSSRERLVSSDKRTSYFHGWGRLRVTWGSRVVNFISIQSDVLILQF